MGKWKEETPRLARGHSVEVGQKSGLPDLTIFQIASLPFGVKCGEGPKEVKNVFAPFINGGETCFLLEGFCWSESRGVQRKKTLGELSTNIWAEDTINVPYGGKTASTDVRLPHGTVNERLLQCHPLSLLLKLSFKIQTLSIP